MKAREFKPRRLDVRAFIESGETLGGDEPLAGFEAVRRVPVTVRVRSLSEVEIETYLRLEQPYDCAGSAKCETLGITLLDAIESDDPTALVGLPLIVTSALLRAAGLDALAVLAGHGGGA